MKYRSSFLFCLVLLLGITGGVGAAENSYHITGEQLLDYCKDTINMMDNKHYNVSKSSWCIGFIQGSVTSHRFYSTYYLLKNPANQNLSDAELDKKINEYQVYCAPASATLGQIIRDVAKYLQENPQYQKEQASMGVARALYQTYPCR